MTRTPLRISFAGGMSDIPAYYEKDFGCVVSTSINKYIYIILTERLEKYYRVKYSQTENVNTIDEIQHTIVRECLKYMKIDHPLEITAISEVPSRTGLGSSSAFTVGLLHALYAYKGQPVPRHQLAEEASHIEIDILKNPIGKQDQYAAAFGGCNYIEFKEEGVSVCPLKIPPTAQSRLQMFYMGKRDVSTRIHEKLADNMEMYRPRIDNVRDVAVGMKMDIDDGKIVPNLGEWIDLAWAWKTRVTDEITSPEVTTLYECAMTHGAMGAKLLGEGGNGFLLTYKRWNTSNELNKFMPIPEMPFKFDTKGTTIIYEE